MASPDPTSSAYQIGQVIGVLLVIGLPLLFSYFVYQYVSHKQKRHLVFLVLTGLPTLGIVGLFVFGMVTAISGAAQERANRQPMTAIQLQDLQNGSWDELGGKRFNYRLQLPGKAGWLIKSGVGDFDQIATYRELYIGIIPELLDIGLDNYVEVIQSNAKEKFPDVEFMDEGQVEIDGKTWAHYDMKLTLQGMKLHYRNYLCAHEGKVVQVLSWSSASQFANCSEVVDRIARSFRYHEF